jgi:hypothetical protein
MEDSLAQTVDDLIHRLITTIQELPADRVAEVLDFADYLHSRYAQTPERGSARAILRVLEDVGPLEFVPGELDALLDDIARARDSDLDDRG